MLILLLKDTKMCLDGLYLNNIFIIIQYITIKWQQIILNSLEQNLKNQANFHFD